MLNTLFKVTGIISFIAIIVAILLLFLLNLENPKNISLSKEAQSKAIMQVTNTEKKDNTILFLLKIKNNSDEMLFLHGLVISIVSENNEVIDKCSVRTSEAVPRSIPPNEENTVKVICNDMQFSAKYSDRVRYTLKFEEGF